MKKKKYVLLLFTIMIFYLVPKVCVVLASIIDGVEISFYSVSMFLITLLFLLFFVFFIRIICNSDKKVQIEQLHKISKLLLFNTFLASVVSLVKTIRFIMKMHSKWTFEELTANVAIQISNEVGLISYLTSSICFFIIIKLVIENSDTEKIE